jgi:hypothetical protein
MGYYGDWRTNRYGDEGAQAREDWSRGGDNWSQRGDRERWDEQGIFGGGSDWTSSRTYGREGEHRGGRYTTPGNYETGRRTSDVLSGERYSAGRFSGKGPKGYRRSDERITEEVCERLTRHPEIDASEVEIRVNAGEVTLTGFVEDRYQKRVAEDIAEEVSGVNDVHNELKVTKGVGQRIGEALGLKDKEPEYKDHTGQGPTGRTMTGEPSARPTTEPARR